jgi:hypothetical protein
MPGQDTNNVQPEEKKREEAVSTSPVKTTTSHHDTQPRKQSNSVHGKAHRNSVKGPPRVNYSIPMPPSDSNATKPTSPLPVRTIPRESCTCY